MKNTPSKHNVVNKIFFTAIGSFILLAAYFIVTIYKNQLERSEQEQLHQLRAVVRTLAAQIDPDVYRTLLEQWSNDLENKNSRPRQQYLKLSNALQNVAINNQLTAPVYVLSKSPEANALFYVLSSSPAGRPGQRYRRDSKVLLANYTTGGQYGPYRAGTSTWLSAFFPVKDQSGMVLGIVVAEKQIDAFYREANKTLAKDILLSIALLTAISLLLRGNLSKVIEIIRQKEKAEHQALVKARFLSTMSHEIRTPLNAVIGLTNVLLQDQPRKDQMENLQTIKFSADLLLALINDILDFSKLEAGKINFEIIPFDLPQLIANITNSLERAASSKGVNLIRVIDQKVPVLVKSDPVRLSQILTNLIGNAIKFTEKGEVRIELSVKKADEQMAVIHFAVSDTGIGIPQEKIQSIFSSFSQAEANTTRKFGGTGLGLSITKRLLELQNSAIQVESIVGKGSTFSFDLTLPLSKEPIVKESPGKRATEEELQHFDGLEILLVEDNKINVMVARKFLKKWGLKVDVAENGQEALHMVKQKDYGLVLMDLDMPVMDGYEATRAIRALQDQKYQQLPIIALSASAVADFRRIAMEAGMNEFVTKPFQPVELNHQLSKFLVMAN